jgi:hypothetical protein
MEINWPPNPAAPALTRPCSARNLSDTASRSLPHPKAICTDRARRVKHAVAKIAHR